jgi:NADH:ubiquinone oxidoreductase subunit 6 (subunit J)
MKIMFYVLSVMVAIFAFWSLIQGVQSYLAGDGFQITPFAIAIVGILLAGLWLRRARSM